MHTWCTTQVLQSILPKGAQSKCLSGSFYDMNFPPPPDLDIQIFLLRFTSQRLIPRTNGGTVLLTFGGGRIGETTEYVICLVYALGCLHTAIWFAASKRYSQCPSFFPSFFLFFFFLFFFFCRVVWPQITRELHTLKLSTYPHLCICNNTGVTLFSRIRRPVSNHDPYTGKTEIIRGFPLSS
jgi:hypothetical protein